jgi:hypothetical protein
MDSVLPSGNPTNNQIINWGIMITFNLSMVDALSIPILFKKESDKKQTKGRVKIDKKTEKQRKEYKEKHILCKFCEHKITTTAYKTEIEGNFKHAFLNPAGHIFEIGCFTRADGCVSLGIPSYEWTWFKDYKWQVALCRECSSHLGWFYSSEQKKAFFGLILNTLI